MLKNCGLVRQANPCRCKEQVERDINIGLINPKKLDFDDKSKQNKNPVNISRIFEELDEMGKMITLFRTYPRYSTPKSFTEILKNLIDSQRFTLLQY